VLVTYDPSTVYPEVTPSFIGTSTRNVYDIIILSVSTTIPTCLGNGVTVTYSWSSSDTLQSIVPATESSITLAPYSFVSGLGKTITCEVSLSTGGSTTSSFNLDILQGNVIATIAGPTELRVSAGNQLALNASTSRDMNISPSLPQNLGFMWSCLVIGESRTCGAILSTALEPVLIVNANQMTVNTTYQFTVTVTSLFDEKRVDSTSVIVTTAPSAAITNSISLTVDSYKFNYNEQIRVDSTITGTLAGTATWSMPGSPATLLSSSALSALSTSFTADEVASTGGVSFPLTLKEKFQSDNGYTFRLSSGSIFSEITLSMRILPYGGSFTVTPGVGEALTTEFRFSASDWNGDVDDLPLMYEYRFSRKALDLKGLVLRKPRENRIAKAILPSGLQGENDQLYLSLVVHGITGNEAMAYATVNVTVGTYMTTDFIGAGITNAFASYSRTGDTDYAMQSTNVYSSQLNMVECGLAPDCKSLNREACSSIPNTCGVCRSGYDGAETSNYPCIAIKNNTPVTLASQLSCTGSLTPECPLGVCTDGVCTVTSKTCQSSTSDICSGHGTCQFYDIASGDTIADCLGDDVHCGASCVCSVGFYGADCHLTAAEMSSVSSLRAHMCAGLSNITSSMPSNANDLQGVIGSFNNIAKAYELLTAEDMSHCAKALSGINSHVNINKRGIKNVFNEYAQSISILVTAKEAVSGSVYTNETETVVLEATQSLTESISSYMVAGQSPISVFSENLRIKVHNDPLANLLNTRVDYPIPYIPPILAEAAPPAQYIVLPSTGLNTCGYPNKHAQFSLSEWSRSPYMSSTKVESPVIRYTSLSNSPRVSTTATSELYDLVLQFTTPQSWLVATPNCTLIGAPVSNCPCSVVSYTSNDVSFKCRDINRLCGPNTGSNNRRLATAQTVSSTVRVTEMSAIVVPTPPGPTAFATANDVELDIASGTTFFTIFLFCVGVGVLIFSCWDAWEHSNFRQNREALRRSDVKPPEFQLQDAFCSPGIDTQSLVSFKHPPKDGRISDRAHAHVKGLKEDDDHKNKTYWQTINSPVSLIDGSTSVIYMQALLKNHSILRMFTYGSLRVTRTLRFVMFVSDILLILFVDTAFYTRAFPYDNNCKDHTDFNDCLVEDSSWIDGDKMCSWDWASLECSQRNPEGDFRYYLTVAVVIMFVCMIPLCVIKWSFEFVYSFETKAIWDVLRSRQNALESETEDDDHDTKVRRSIARRRSSRRSSDKSRRSSLFPVTRSSLSPEEQEELFEAKKCRVLDDLDCHPETDEHLRNKVVIQHFVHERVTFVERFFLRNWFFNSESATPERPEILGIILWFFTFLATVALWIFFVAYIYIWTTNNTYDIVYAWGVSFVFCWLIYVFIAELFQIFVWHVLPIAFLRRRLTAIYDVLSLHTKETAQDTEAPGGGLVRAKSVFETDGRKYHSPTGSAITELQKSGDNSKARKAQDIILSLSDEALHKLDQSDRRKSLFLAPLARSSHSRHSGVSSDTDAPQSRRAFTSATQRDSSLAEQSTRGNAPFSQRQMTVDTEYENDAFVDPDFEAESISVGPKESRVSVEDTPVIVDQVSGSEAKPPSKTVPLSFLGDDDDDEDEESEKITGKEKNTDDDKIEVREPVATSYIEPDTPDVLTRAEAITAPTETFTLGSTSEREPDDKKDNESMEGSIVDDANKLPTPPDTTATTVDPAILSPPSLDSLPVDLRKTGVPVPTEAVAAAAIVKEKDRIANESKSEKETLGGVAMLTDSSKLSDSGDDVDEEEQEEKKEGSPLVSSSANDQERSLAAQLDSDSDEEIVPAKAIE